MPDLRLITDPEEVRIPQTGAVSSRQRAEVDLPAQDLERLWTQEQLERLARSYWQHLTRISIGLLRVIYEPAGRIVVLLARPLPLLRFHTPEYSADERSASVTWRIERGILVARAGRDRGHLRIAVEKLDGAAPGQVRIGVSTEVHNFYPWLRGSGRFARLGTWLYGRTQARIHVLVSNRFLTSLGRFD